MITKKCSVSDQKFEITSDDIDFYRKMEIISAADYEKLKSREISECVGLPTLCPSERQRRRLSWRNERKLYPKKCKSCEKSIVSLYDESAKFPVFCQKCWWGDTWDGKNFSRDFDFAQPFFGQFKKLSNNVPQITIINDDGKRSENCEYCQDFSFGKNCYLVTETWHTKDSLYSHHCDHCTEIVDCSGVHKNSELCYECVNCFKVYDSIFLQDSENCNNCYFGLDLIGCSDCMGCVGLRNKKYHLFNKKLNKDDYFREKEKILDSIKKFSKLEKYKKIWEKHVLQFSRKYSAQKNCENCSGHEIFHSKNSFNIFGTFKSEDSKYLINSDSPKNSYDSQGGAYQWNIETQTCDNSYEAFFSLWCWKSKNIYYSDNCHSSSHLFGCIGLKNAQYCILNKQYIKEEYFKLREKIIEHMKKTGEWGEFFPIALSPFAYNETVAQEYFPLTKEQAVAQGYEWKDKISRDFRPATIAAIPDDISDVDDSICTEILACENKNCGKNYQIQRAELEFYRKMNLPIPRKCPDCRHAERMKLRNPRKLFARTCTECERDIQTTFAPYRPERVLCEECYLRVVD